MEEIEMYLGEAREMMDKAINHTQSELQKIRAGKAMPNMVDGIYVDYYGVSTPIAQAATISTPDARTIQIRPFEKKMAYEIEKAIVNSQLGLTPQNDGESIRLNLPPLTEERRRDLVKKSKVETEQGKVGIRNARKEVNEALRKLLKDGASEDAIKGAEEKVQQYTDQYVAKIDLILEAKEKEIMTV
jgi:ribosome recycling factor